MEMETVKPRKPRKSKKTEKDMENFEPAVDQSDKLNIVSLLPEQQVFIGGPRVMDAAPTAATHKKEAEVDIPDTIKKAKLISDLSAVWSNDEVQKVILKQNNGKAIWEVFTKALQNEMEAIMAGNTNTDILSHPLELLASNIDILYRKIDGICKSPIMGTLQILNGKLEGSVPGPLLSQSSNNNEVSPSKPITDLFY